MVGAACLACGSAYPESGAPYACPECGGVFDLREFPEHTGNPGYRVSLGEGQTPLVMAEVHGRQVAFKCEMLNPSGSFKDRGTAALVDFLIRRGVTEAVEDSSGNAGASFAAYAAAAGIRASIFVPESASGPKRRQIEAYGARIVPVPGPRIKAAEAVLKAAKEGSVYASHVYLPFNLPGYATLAYELFEALGQALGAVVVPAGQGGLLLGIARGFQVLQKAGSIERCPVLIGVQAAACAPLAASARGFPREEPRPTLAEGIAISRPLRIEAVVAAVRRSGGRFIAVEEAFILPGRDELARRGLYVEPTSGIIWKALEDCLPGLSDPVAVVLTGSGLKA